MYKYETHLHTSEGSACGVSSGAEMARAHKEAGYDGIFVTDHFFNGNCAVPRDLPWEERIDLFCLGYENAKKEGEKIGLDVWFGFEYGVHAMDFLCYGLDKDWLKAHPYIDKINEHDAFALMRADGGLVIQAHPFRERDYIDHPEIYPRDVDGVEIVNAAQHGQGVMNEMAAMYAKLYELPITGGSDTHSKNILFGGGIYTEEKITCTADYKRLVKEYKVTPIVPDR